MSKTAIITGANKGIGLAVAKNLISKNYQVILACRDITKGKMAQEFLGSSAKFLELDLGEDNVVDILNCQDSSGQKWYEVDYLAQEKVLKETHYTNDSTRDNAYDQGDATDDTSSIPIPYVAEYIKTNKKFTTKFDGKASAKRRIYFSALALESESCIFECNNARQRKKTT